MNQNRCDCKLTSFAETAQLVEDYVRREIIQETKTKQLSYHTINHAEAVKRRANLIFDSIKPILATENSCVELERMQSLLSISAIAHDMVQEFEPTTINASPRKHLIKVSEIATAKKLTDYIKNLNQKLRSENCNSSILFNPNDLKIIEDAILATICDRDPQAEKASYSFSRYSIYQPYLYDPQPKASILGDILALADLGTLAMDGVVSYIQDGILIFLEDNLDLKKLIIVDNKKSDTQAQLIKSTQGNNINEESIKKRIIVMNRFIVDLARERYARLDWEIAGFSPVARKILKEKIFTGLNIENINEIETIVPTNQQTKLADLISFFRMYIHNQ